MFHEFHDNTQTLPDVHILFTLHPRPYPDPKTSEDNQDDKTHDGKGNHELEQSKARVSL
jgi:hypothetical protein